MRLGNGCAFRFLESNVGCSNPVASSSVFEYSGWFPLFVFISAEFALQVWVYLWDKEASSAYTSMLLSVRERSEGRHEMRSCTTYSELRCLRASTADDDFSLDESDRPIRTNPP